MRPRIFLALASFLFFILMVGSISPQSSVQADRFLQSLPTLNGTNIYFTEANGEASRFDQLDNGLSRFAGLLRLQGANLYTLEWRTRFPQNIDLIVIAGPTADFSSDQIARLWSYTMHGGHVLLLVDPVAQANALASTSGVFSLMWNDMNIRGRDDVVVTEASNLASAATAAADEGAPQNSLIANFATSNLNSKHPITASITEPLNFFVARSIQFDASPRDYTVTPLVTSDTTYYGEMDYATYLAKGTYEYNIGINTQGADVPRGPLALAVSYEDPKVGTRLVLVGDRGFAVNAGGFQTSPPGSGSFLYPGNVRFMINSVSWLIGSQSPELSFSTPGPTPTVTITPTFTPTFTPTATSSPTPSAGPTETATPTS